MEAASFEHYLTTAELITFEEATKKLHQLDSQGPGVDLSVEDYLLGIYDMTGELMRFAITAMATNGSLPSIGTSSDDVDMDGETTSAKRDLLTDMRSLRSALETIDAGKGGHFANDISKKAEVMRQSVEKVEKALYGLIIRGRERPKGWMPDTDGGSRSVQVEG